MKAVKTMQKYKCDFCKKRGVKHIMEKHEPSCYRNPNRVCFACNNTGITKTHSYWNEELERYDNDCIFCEKFDKQMLKEIEEREAKVYEPTDTTDIKDINF